MTINTNMYAIALFQAGVENDPFLYLTEIDNFIELLNSDQTIKVFFNTSFDQFHDVKELLLKEFSVSFINFIEILYNNNVLKSITTIRDKYESLMMENNYLSIVNVYSKKELKNETINTITDMLKGKYKEPFRMSFHTDESLIGGYIIKVNGDVYDTSLKSKLLQIQKLGGIAYE